MLRSELWTCSQASKRVLPQEADCSNGIEGNGYPHTTQFRTLQRDMNALIQRGGFWLVLLQFGGCGSARIYPDLPA